MYRKTVWFSVAIFLLPFVFAGSFQIIGSSDNLEIDETFANVVNSLEASDLTELKSGDIETQQGLTKYNQYIKFTGLTRPTVSFKENDLDEVDDFLFIERGTTAAQAFIEYQIEFEEGLKSQIKDSVMTDIEDKNLNLFAKDYVFLGSKEDGGSLELTLGTQAASDLMEEGAKKMFTIGGKNYEVEVTAIDDASKEVEFKVDGKALSKIKKGETTILESGEILGISNVILSSSDTPDIAKMFIGSHVLQIKDSTYTDDNFDQDISVNKKKILNAFGKIKASKTGDIVKISSIHYRVISTEDRYIKENGKLSESIQGNEPLLLDMDLKYEGLSAKPISKVQFSPTNADSEYKLVFKNADDQTITVPFISNKNSFKLGDEDQDLLLQEGTTSSFNIDKNDYFVLTNRNDKNGKSYVVKYNSVDTTAKTIDFEELGTGQTKKVSYSTSNESGTEGEGQLSIGSISAKFLISSSTDNPLTVDLNADGTYSSGTVVDMVIKGGGVLDLSTLSGSTYTIYLKTEASKLDESTSDENIQLVFESRASNKIGVQSSFGSSVAVQTQTQYFYGLSDYGAYLELLDSSSDSAETLSIDYPEEQRFAVVYIDLSASSSGQTVTVQQIVENTCANGKQDGAETGVDCGGSCASCQTQASCSDGINNQDETGVDCGGVCAPCAPEQTCAGCVRVDGTGTESCIGVGEVVETFYCAKDQTLKLLKKNGEACTESYECKIGMCEANKCGKRISWWVWIINLIVIAGVLFFGYQVILFLRK